MVKTKPFVNASQQESGKELSPSQRIAEKKRKLLRERKMNAMHEKVMRDTLKRGVAHYPASKKFTVATGPNDNVAPAVKEMIGIAFPTEKATVIGIKLLGKGVYRSKTKRAATKYNYIYSPAEIMELDLQNPRFTALLNSGEYVYCNGHIVLNKPECFEKVDGELVLSPAVLACPENYCIGRKKLSEKTSRGLYRSCKSQAFRKPKLG